MPIAAGVVRDLGIAASRVLAACDMPAERRGATALDRTHHLQLLEAHMPAVGLAPGRTVIAENVRTSRAGRAMAGVAMAPAAPHCLASHAGGAARADPPGGSRSWQSVRSPRDYSGLSSRAWNVRATLESRECPRRARADGSQSCGEANAARPSCAAPRLWRPP